jgi:D-threonine aldolase
MSCHSQKFTPFPIDQLLTPCLAVFPSVIEQNLRTMIDIAGSPKNLRPHVKTHKCRQIVEMAVSMGIVKHKCATLAEAEMLASVATDVLLAYPQVGPAVKKLADLVCKFSGCRWATVVDSPEDVTWLSSEFSKRDLRIDVYIDIDTGMHRTGIQPSQRAVELARQIQRSPGLHLAGLHVYDGQNHQSDPGQRRLAVVESMRLVSDFVVALQNQGVPVKRLVCGGTPSFPVFAELRGNWQGAAGLPELELSPGTTVLSDFNYDRDFPDIAGIQPAALLLTRVVSKPGGNLVTVDLGYKAVSPDQPAGSRCHFLDLPDAQEVRHSEEHLVIRTQSADRLKLGQMLRVLPAHICPTVALHDQMMLLDDSVILDDSVGFDDSVVLEKLMVVDQWPVVRYRLYH